MAQTVIRRATLADTQKLLEIYAYYVRNTAITFECDVPSEAEFRERIRKTLLKYPYLVLEQGERLLGYTYAGPFVGRAAFCWSAEVTVYLAADAQKKGYGKQLYQALEAELKKLGIRNLYACIAYPNEEDEYLTKNSARFHSSMDYRQVGVFRNCGNKFNRWYSMIWMEKIIGEYTDHPDDDIALK